MLYPTARKFSRFGDFDFGVIFGPVSDLFLPILSHWWGHRLAKQLICEVWTLSVHEKKNSRLHQTWEVFRKIKALSPTHNILSYLRFLQQLSCTSFRKRALNSKDIVNIQILFVLTVGDVDMTTYPLRKYYYIIERIFFIYRLFILFISTF